MTIKQGKGLGDSFGTSFIHHILMPSVDQPIRSGHM